MSIPRRHLVRSLGAGILGAGALTACGEGMPRGRGRGRRRSTTPAPTAGALSEPEQPLVLGSIGASHGRTAPFEHAIAIGIREALIDLNHRDHGLFGQDVQIAQRHVMAEAGEDLADVIADLADSGVTAVITSLDEDALIAAMPAFVEAGIAVIDVITSGMNVRSTEVATSGMLVRLSPNNRTLAAMYAEASWSGGSSDRSGTPGTVAFVSENTSQGEDLLHEMKQVLEPAGGRIVAQHFYPFGALEDSGALVEEVLESPPGLLVVNGGPEVGPFLSGLHEATLDEGQRPTVEVPVRLNPAATVDYVDAELAPESLMQATGHEPGGELTDAHVHMMINVDPQLRLSGFAYSQHSYDAVTLAGLAAQDSLSVQGTDIAAAIPGVLTGSEDCTDFGTCVTILRDALIADSRTTISFTGRMGALELDAGPDPRAGQIRTYSWNDAGGIEAASADSFEAPG